MNKLNTSALTVRIIKYTLVSILVGLLFQTLVSYGLILGFTIGMIVSALIVYLEYSNTEFTLDKGSLFIKQGMFSTQSITIPFAKITQLKVNQGILQRIFSVATVVIDQEDAECSIRDIDMINANKMREAVSQKSNIQPISSK